MFEGLIKESYYQLSLIAESPELKQNTVQNIMKTWQIIYQTAIKYLVNFNLDQEGGFEPPFWESKSHVLPLDDSWAIWSALYYLNKAASYQLN